jgi:hypothetical protein
MSLISLGDERQLAVHSCVASLIAAHGWKTIGG